jgi:uncharacterized membrane protein YwzB
MLKELVKRRIEVIFIVGGLIFIFLSHFKYQDSNFDLLDKTNISTLIIGIVLILLGILWVVIPYIVNNYFFDGFHKIKKLKDGSLLTKIERVKGKYHKLHIHFGSITDFNRYDKNTLVVLPANDKFDDDCIEDLKSALGFFINKLFPNKVDIIKEHIKKELNKREKKVFEIGQCVYLDLSENDFTDYNFKIAFVAVTHLLENDVIKAYSQNISMAMRGVRVLMDKKRLSKLYLPLIGSGHGGLSAEVSLLNIMLSVLEIIVKDHGQRLDDVNIIVFQKEGSEPIVTRKRARKIISFAIENSK